jgi:hypothetical protein
MGTAHPSRPQAPDPTGVVTRPSRSSVDWRDNANSPRKRPGTADGGSLISEGKWCALPLNVLQAPGIRVDQVGI